MSDKPAITAILPWFGSKRTMAPLIVKQLGKHSAYWEPFCGSLSVLLAKPPSSHETVNDLHGELINLARVIADENLAPQLYAALSRLLCDESVRDEMLALAPSEDPVERARRYFAVAWLGRNGFTGTVGCEKSSFAVRWTPGGGHGGQRFASAVESIPAWHHRLRRVTILNRDGFGVLDKIDDHPRVAIYCDPPYIEKEASYEHDFESLSLLGDDHARLAVSLGRFKKTRVVLSYYRHERLADLYPADMWRRVDCSMNKGLHNAGRRGQTASIAPEVLLVNGEAYT